jgi:gliding motility-associated-like protein
MIVHVLPIPVIEAGADSSICGNTVQLYGVADALSSGIWSASGLNVEFDDETDITTIVSQLVQGENTLYWTATDGTCTAQDSVVISSHVAWTADAGNNLSICGFEANLFAVPVNGTGTWSSNSAESFWPDENTPDAAVTSSTYGSFVFTWTETDGVCATSINIDVTFWQPVSDADAGVDQNLIDEYVTVLDGNEVSVGYGCWSSTNPDILKADSLAFDTEIYNLNYGLNTMLWTITNGACESSIDEVNIIVNESALPTGFSPNNDGFNDMLEFNGLEQMAYTKITVYDRWGNLVYEMENYDNSWDGSSSGGSLLPDDTYFYVFNKDGVELSSYVVIRR